MDWMRNIQEAVDYIENNILTDINCEANIFFKFSFSSGFQYDYRYKHR